MYDTGEAVVKNSLNCFKTKVNWHQVIAVGVKPEEEQHNINLCMKCGFIVTEGLIHSNYSPK